MGNFLKYSVDSSLKRLSKYPLQFIRKVFDKFQEKYQNEITLSTQQFLTFTTAIPEKTLTAACRHFDLWNLGVINMYEFFTALVCYSQANVNDKLQMLFQLLDFNRLSSWTETDVELAIRIVLNGICRMIDTQNVPLKILDTVTSEVMAGRDTVNLEEIKEYVKTCTPFQQMLEKTSVGAIAGLNSFIFDFTTVMFKKAERNSKMSFHERRNSTTAAFNMQKTPKAKQKRSFLPNITSPKGSISVLTPKCKPRKVNGMIICGELFTRKTVKNLKTNFDNFDVKKTGKINLSEFLAFKSCSKHLKSSVHEMIQNYGLNRYSLITFEEFLRFMLPTAASHQINTLLRWINYVRVVEEEAKDDADLEDKPKQFPRAQLKSLKKLFKVIDKDHDEKITLFDFKRIFCLVPNCEQMFKSVSKGSDKIEFDAFIEIMKPDGWDLPPDYDQVSLNETV